MDIYRMFTLIVSLKRKISGLLLHLAKQYYKKCNIVQFDHKVFLKYAIGFLLYYLGQCSCDPLMILDMISLLILL